MSLEQQIEEAWKEYWEANSEWVFSHNKGTFIAGAKAGIEIGRREALASLYVEVKPADVSAGVDYWVLKDGVWRDAWWFSDRLALGEARQCEKILKLNLPSPSSVFGGGA